MDFLQQVCLCKEINATPTLKAHNFAEEAELEFDIDEYFTTYPETNLEIILVPTSDHVAPTLDTPSSKFKTVIKRNLTAKQPGPTCDEIMYSFYDHSHFVNL